MKKHLLLLLSCISLGVLAQAPVGYYDNIDGKKKEELKTALHNVLKEHVSMGFNTFSAQFWGDVYYKKVDWHPDGYYWDMYSDNKRTVYNGTDMAREHCMPRSWWKEGTDYGLANHDLLNLYPSDSKANGQKSDHPLGEVGIAAYDNGVIKVGQNTYPGGSVVKSFEPADEYKGDFARTYFYMVTCYEDYATYWKGEGVSMLNNETYPVLKDWAIDMLLEWHQNDPVSQKEIDRNNLVFGLQYNRNPFIDSPELADYIWGTKTSDSYSVPVKAASASLFTPTTTSTLDFGTVVGYDREVYVKGVLLTKPVKVEFVSGDTDAFVIRRSVGSVGASDANDGYRLKVAYVTSNEGPHSAVLRFSSDEIATIDVAVSGTHTKVPENVDPIVPADDMDVMIFHSSSVAGLSWDKAKLPVGFVATVSGAPYASGDLSFKKTGENLVVKFDEEPDLMQFALRAYGAWGEADNHVYVYESADGTAWGSPIEDVDNTVLIVTYYNTPEIILSPSTRAIKIEYVKANQNVGLNNLIITRASSGTGIGDISDGDMVQVYVRNGVLYVVNVTEGIPVYVYDTMGKQVFNGISYSDGEVTSLQNRGIYIVRVGNKAYKVMN